VIGSETNSASGRPSHTVGDTSRYFLLFAMQTIGAAILFWYAVPLFRQGLLDPGGHVARSENLVWSLSAFVLATSVFGFVFIVRRPEFQLPTSRYFAVIIGLFALFCYTQELEQVGRALIGPDPSKRVSPINSCRLVL
jgi:hypothetical protein